MAYLDYRRTEPAKNGCDGQMKAYHMRPLLERMASVDSPQGRHAARYVDAQIIEQPKQVAQMAVVAVDKKVPAVYSGAPQTTLKFCKDCSWHKGGDGWGKERHRCASPNLLNLVTGEFSDCEQNRRFHDKCGRGARYFEIRHVPEILFRLRVVETHDQRAEPDDYRLPFMGTQNEDTPPTEGLNK